MKQSSLMGKQETRLLRRNLQDGTRKGLTWEDLEKRLALKRDRARKAKFKRLKRYI